jgi:hypothetical protein
MGFLLAKILLLLLAAAVCGALLAWWWFRRYYEDVTVEYTRSREEWAAWRQDFEERLAARPPVDLGPLAGELHGRLDELERRIGDIRVPPAPDLAPTEKRLMAIEHALFPVQTRIDQLESAVRALHVPSPQAVDLSAVLERLDALQSHLQRPPAPKVAVREGARAYAPQGGRVLLLADRRVVARGREVRRQQARILQRQHRARRLGDAGE